MTSEIKEILDNSCVSTTQLVRSKTPVTSLQELCTKRGITPVYELLASEGRVHEPLFIFRVAAGGCSSEGKGPSKKKAKHNAAALLLVQLLPSSTNNGQTLVDHSDCSTTLSLQEDLESNDSVNYVGELQELSQRHLWPLPVYECTGENGLAHEREFVCTVRLFSLSETGSGKSKKQAKRNAAENLLKLIKSNTDVESLSSLHSSSNSDDVNGQTYEEVRNTVISLKTGCKIQTLSPKDSLEISHFYNGLKYRTGKTLASLQVLALNMPATNYCQMLQEIAEEQNFEAVYADIPHLTIAGQFQCLVQLSSMPVAVCQGVGRSKDEARSMAAHNALQYLKIMTRK